MNDFSLVEKLKILMDIIVSSPLFLFCSMFAISLLIYFIICIKKEKKINKLIFISIWIVLGLILIINYNSIILDLIDNLFDSLFMVLYFPSLTTYVTIILISNVFFIYSLVSKKVKKIYKITNFINMLLTNLLLVLIIDTVKNNEINIYDELNLYTNSNLLVLLELSSAIFVSWTLIILLISAHNKLKKYDKKELPKMPEIVFEDV